MSSTSRRCLCPRKRRRCRVHSHEDRPSWSASHPRICCPSSALPLCFIFPPLVPRRGHYLLCSTGRVTTTTRGAAAGASVATRLVPNEHHGGCSGGGSKTPSFSFGSGGGWAAGARGPTVVVPASVLIPVTWVRGGDCGHASAGVPLVRARCSGLCQILLPHWQCSSEAGCRGSRA